MKWQSLPPATPGVLLRHPALLAEWLRITNGLRRWRVERAGSLAMIVTASFAALMLVAVVLGIFMSQLTAAIVVIARYWVLTTAVAALYAATSIAKRRRHVHDSHLQSWLIATPIPPSSVRWSNGICSVIPLLAQFVAIAAFILLSQWLGHGIHAVTGTAIGAIVGGLFIGGCVGWLAKSDRSRHPFEGSRYVPRARPHAELRPDDAALAGWPIAQVRAWSRPENSRYLLVAALLAVQGGSSAVTGLSVIAMYFLGGYLTALLSAVLKVAKSAALWLRSTPMTLSDFVCTLARRVLLHQALGTALTAGVMLLLGSPVSLALQVAALWLLLVISISGFALVDGYRGRSPVVKIALSVAMFAAFAAAWQFRAGAKA